MKALNAGLLVVGAALAGGVAYKLTEPPQVPVSVTKPVLEPPPENLSPPPAVVPLTREPVTRWRPAEPAVASAPPPVYTDPQPATPRYSKPSPLQARPVAPPPTPQIVAKAAPVPDPVPYKASPVVAVPPAPKSEPKPEAKPEPPARHVTLQAGDAVAVRTAGPLSADGMKVGEVFSGVLAEPLIAEGLVVGERGARVSGRVIAINENALTLRLLNFQTADGQRIEISTEPVTILNGNILRFRLAAKIVITERRI